MTKLRTLLHLLHHRHGISYYALARYLRIPYPTLHRWATSSAADAPSSKVEAAYILLLQHPTLAAHPHPPVT